MFPLDNGKNGYTWSDNWIHPYESAWNIGEKLYAANVSKELYNRIINVSQNGIKMNYSSKLLSYLKGPVKSDFFEPFLQSSQVILNQLFDKEYYTLSQTRYCPECAKLGYHSVIHQLSFMDKCFIHNQKLVFLCDCEYSSALVWKCKEHLPFSCVKCGAKMPYPEVSDGIMNKWKNEIIFSKLVPSLEIKQIYTVDVMYDNSSRRGTLSSIQRDVLKRVLFEESIERFPKPLLICNQNKYDKHLSFLAKEIQNYIIEKYGEEKCKEQFYLLERYVNADSYSKFQFDIIAAFYLMGELLKESYLDRIYPVQFGGMTAKNDYYNNILLLSVNKLFLHHKKQTKYNIYEIINYIYKEYAIIRYSEIRNALTSSEATDYPIYGYHIPVGSNKVYPVYIIIETKDELLRLY